MISPPPNPSKSHTSHLSFSDFQPDTPRFLSPLNMTTPTPNKDASKAKDASIFQGIEDTIERNRRSASPSPSEPSQEVSEPSNSKAPTLPNPTQTPTQD